MSNKLTAYLAILALTQTFNIGGSTQSDLIRVALSKSTSMEAGEFGQPVTNYYTDLGIGTPLKNFKMLIDIDAKETWLPHYSRIGIIYYRLNYKNGYLGKDSSTGIKDAKEVAFEYQDCELIGKVYEDNFQFRNVTGSLGSAQVRQHFVAVHSASNGRFSKWASDGVLGLAPAFTSDSGSRSILINLQYGRQIGELKFALALNQNPEDGPAGELTLGGFNPTKFLGQIFYHQLATHRHRWELKLNDVSLGSQVVSCYQSNCSATLSSGVNDFYGPRDDVAQMMNLLGVAKSPRLSKRGKEQDACFGDDELYEIECLRVANLPALTFNIDGMTYVVPPTSYVKKKVDGLIFKSATCYVAIFPTHSKGQWILGTNFLSNYYTVFDLNNRRVGFAARRL